VNEKWEKHDPPQRPDQNQTDVSLNLFITPDNNAKYCDEVGMKRLGSITVVLSDSREQKKSMGLTLKKRVVEVELILTFGTVEIKVTTINKKTGQAYLCWNFN
ncbi:21393_t:CDS:2, partial [Racocetra persica]